MSSSFSIGNGATVELAARTIVSRSSIGDTDRTGCNATAGSSETNGSSLPSPTATSIRGAAVAE